MGRRKKAKIQEEIFDEIISQQVCKKEEDINLNFSSPFRIKTRQIQQISTIAPRRKTRKIYKTKTKLEEERPADLFNEMRGVQVKLEDNDLLEQNESSHNNEYIDDQKISTVEVSDDIRGYYELLDITQTLDALVIKYYNDPLLYTFRMDTNSDSKVARQKKKIIKLEDDNRALEEQFSNLKMQQRLSMEDISSNQVIVKVQERIQYSQGISEMREENNEETVKEQILSSRIISEKQQIRDYNYQNDEGSFKNLKLEKLLKRQLNLFSRFQLQIENNLKQNHKEYKYFLNDQEQANFSSCQLTDIHRSVSQLAVFIDMFSAQQFQKLHKLKYLLNSTLSSVNKSVKYHLNQMSTQEKENISNKQAIKQRNIRKIQQKTQKSTKNKKKQIQQKQNDDNDDDHHVCRVCWQFFMNGHQLGGHMSKKHPGISMEYRNKQLIKTRKAIERQRRLYFKMIQRSSNSLTNIKPKKNKKQKNCKN